MLYVQQSLGPDEELVHVGRFHWIYTFHAFLSIVWGILGSLIIVMGAVFAYKHLGKFPPHIGWVEGVRYLHPGIRLGAFVVFLLGLVSFAQMMVIKATTEIAITNTRLIYKRGLIARQVGEMNIDRIESVNVLQSFTGRLFNYGRLAIRGMGIGEVLIPPIEDPIAFRKAIERARTV